MSDWMMADCPPLRVTLPDGTERTFTRRIDLWGLLRGMTEVERIGTTVRTGYALAPEIEREDDGQYVYELLAMETGA